MPSAVRGTHHYTSGVGGAQEDFDFHARLLGLRFLKQTGLYEGNGSHLTTSTTAMPTVIPGLSSRRSRCVSKASRANWGPIRSPV